MEHGHSEALRQRFLEPETRNGYFISAEMKAVWKTELDIVEEFTRICAKHGLRYSLAGGTLIGAMRHGGYIPWDDDIDIDMVRVDYDRFLEIAPQELKEPLILQTTSTCHERIGMFAEIKNGNTAAIDPYWAKQHARFNMGIGIDIFPVDGVPDSPADFTRMVKRFKRVQRLIQNTRHVSGKGFSAMAKFLVAKFVQGIVGAEKLVELREDVFRENLLNNCKLCGEISYRIDSERFRWPSSCYDSYIDVPFEYLTLKVASGYDAMLTTQYGDWRKPVQGLGDHGELVIDARRPYKEVLAERFGYKKEWLDAMP